MAINDIYKRILQDKEIHGWPFTIKKYSGIIQIRLHRFVSIVIEIILYPFYRIAIGSYIKLNDKIWPPTYKKYYNSLHFWLIERPLQKRGVHLPNQSPADGSHFHTYNSEHILINKILDSISSDITKYYVDIGAGDGIDMSNTYLLGVNGWNGLSIETSPARFARMATVYQRLPHISLIKTQVTPQNVLDLLRSSITPKNLGLLSIDIDSYDYFVLKEILSEYKPQLLIAEINPMIPSNVLFSIKYNPDFTWEGKGYFQGMSLALLKKLSDEYGYDIVEVNKCAAFLVDKNVPRNGPSYTLTQLDLKIVASYEEIDKKLRAELNASPEKALAYVRDVICKGENIDRYLLDVC